MSNPRTAPAFTELDVHYTTYTGKLYNASTATDGIDFLHSPSSAYPSSLSTQIGKSMAISANGTVHVGAADEMLTGLLVRVEGDLAVEVQDRGFMTFPYTAGATAPVLGRGVVCNGSGGVQIASSGKENFERGEVIWKDATALTVIVRK